MCTTETEILSDRLTFMAKKSIIMNTKRAKLSVFPGLGNIIGAVGGAVVGLGVSLVTEVFEEPIKECAGWVADRFVDAGEWIADTAVEAWNATTDFVEDAGEWITETASDAGEWIADTATDVWNATTDFVEDVGESISNGLESVGNFFSGLFSW